MFLTDVESKMRDGHQGEAVSMAMSILVVALPRTAFDRLQTGQAAAVDGVKGEIVIGSAQ